MNAQIGPCLHYYLQTPMYYLGVATSGSQYTIHGVNQSKHIFFDFDRV